MKEYTIVEKIIPLTADEHEAGVKRAASQKFTDDGFAICNLLDDTKQVSFDVSSVSTATNITITIPNHNLDLNILKEDDNGNVFLGSDTSPNIDEGNLGSNLVVGFQSGFNLKTGYENVFLGYFTGRFIEDGYNNTVVGSNSGFSGRNTEGQGNANTILGQFLYLTPDTNENVIIGNGKGTWAFWDDTNTAKVNNPMQFAEMTTAQRNALPDKPNTTVYDTDTNTLYYNNGTMWKAI